MKLSEVKPLSQRIQETIGPYGENADPVATAWADEVEDLESVNAVLLAAVEACISKLEKNNLEHCHAGFLAYEATRSQKEND